MDIFGRSLFCTPEGYQTYRDVHTLLTQPTWEGAALVAQTVKNPSATRETWV